MCRTKNGVQQNRKAPAQGNDAKSVKSFPQTETPVTPLLDLPEALTIVLRCRTWEHSQRPPPCFNYCLNSCVLRSHSDCWPKYVIQVHIFSTFWIYSLEMFLRYVFFYQNVLCSWMDHLKTLCPQRQLLQMLLALLFVHCKSLQRCLSPLSKDEVFLYSDCKGHSLWFTPSQRVLCIVLLKDISAIRIEDSRFKVVIVICAVRKHVSLYNEILPLLSTEWQQCRGSISSIHLNPAETLDQLVWQCVYHHHQCWFIPPVAIMNQSQGALNLF